VAKVVIEHKDILGQPVSVGNYVAVSHHNMMHIAQIVRITPKMMKVSTIGRYKSEIQVYSDQSVLLSGPDALVYILKHAGS
jgi:hypothetical protein